MFVVIRCGATPSALVVLWCDLFVSCHTTCHSLLRACNVVKHEYVHVRCATCCSLRMVLQYVPLRDCRFSCAVVLSRLSVGELMVSCAGVRVRVLLTRTTYYNVRLLVSAAYCTVYHTHVAASTSHASSRKSRHATTARHHHIPTHHSPYSASRFPSCSHSWTTARRRILSVR